MAEEIHSKKARMAVFLIVAAALVGGSSAFFAQRAYAAGTLTVSGYALDGRPLSMWVVISQSGATVKTGFTPLTFAGAGTYTVQAHDYSGGSVFFDHWDNGSTARARTVTLGSDAAAVAVAAYYSAPPPPNRAPVAANDSAVMDQDTAMVVNALANDRDADNDPLSLSSVGTPAHGSALANADNTVTYTPAAGYSGQDSFTYTISDGRGGSSTATVAVQVNFVNYRPAVAGGQNVSTAEDTSLPVTLGGTDANGDALSFLIAEGPAHGTLSPIAGNRTIYTPAADYNGPDSFSFKASDGKLESSSAATVFITISPVNDAPVADGQSISTSEDVAKSIALSASDVDGDVLLYSITTAPLHGTLSGTIPNITYVPDGNYYGSDSFAFRASDGKGADSNTATVAVTVVPVNDIPVAGNDSAATSQDTAVNIGVLSNDSDADGDALKVISATAPAHGSAAVNADNNTVTYRPAAGFSGSDSFVYAVSDGNGGSATATVTVTVRPVQSTYALTVSSADMYGKPTGGLYTVIKQGSATAKTGFTTLTYTGAAGATYSVTVSDYGSTLFDHWDNGSTARARTVTLNSDAAITAVFRVPTINLTPASGPNGTMILVSGTYFTPGSPVTVTYDGRSVASAITSSTAGAFSASFAAPALETGFHTVQATDGKGWKASARFEDTTPPPPHPLRYLIPKNGIYVALYMYPSGDGALEWQKVIDAKKAHPSVPIVATFNPNSGPGNSKDSNFATWVGKLKSAGVIAIGYTHDSYGTRPLSALKADADKYRNWYGADGLFIDEFTNKVGFEAHYKDLTTYAKSIGMKMTMGNPGTDVPKSYIGSVDVINITEGKGYMPISWLQYCVQCSADQGWHYQHDSLYFSYIRYDIGSLDTAFEVESSRWAGLLYITDGNDSDGRWFHLPPYFGTEVAMLDK